MARRTHSQNWKRRGVVAVFVAISLVAVVGVVGISVDGGALLLEKRRARAVADATAMAAACELFKQYPAHQGKDGTGSAKAAAEVVAANNGYPKDGADTDIEVFIPPSTGPYKGKDGYAEVIVTKKFHRGFSRVFGTEPITVRARAVSRGAWIAPNAGVIILDYDDKSSLNAQGNGAFTETGGPVIVNSSNPDAVIAGGNGTLIAEEFYITGGVKLSGGNAGFETAPQPGKIYLGTHPTPDPLAYLPEPAVPADGTMTTINLGDGAKLYNLTPGRYADLPLFGSKDQIILQQASAGNGGIYYIDGGGFKSTGATITMDPATSGGLMIYNKPAGTQSSQKIQITGNAGGVVHLAPLTDGPYAGMMLWQDRTSPVDVQVEGNGSFSVRGTFYAAGAPLKIAGNGKTDTGDPTGSYTDEFGNVIGGASRIGSQYVSKNLTISGNGNVNINYYGPGVARTRIITLVE